jgi:hypothetical protein
MAILFGDFDALDFWEASEYADREYVEPEPDAALIASVEAELGYRLPQSYVDLARLQNGGIPTRKCFRVVQTGLSAADYVVIDGIKAIGRARNWSLCGELGSRQLMDEWGYPPIGIYFGDTPSAGHDAFCLDYRACGPAGEPSVVHVDQEDGYRITPIAPTFEAFVRGLEAKDAFDSED